MSIQRIARSYTFFPVFTILALLVSTTASGASWFDRVKGALSGESKSVSELTTSEVGNGLKEALRVGTNRVVENLGQTDGFNLDPNIRIPLPSQLQQAQRLLEKVGMDGLLTDLEVRLNRAAEIATPKAQRLFIETIQGMTLEDVMAIYNGPDDAATQYFREATSTQLAAEMKPVVDEGLAEAGAVKAYDTMLERYNAIPFAPKVNADLGDYVVEQGMNGIFFYLAEEEAAIRENPAKRTTELLKKVFRS